MGEAGVLALAATPTEASSSRQGLRSRQRVFNNSEGMETRRKSSRSLAESNHHPRAVGLSAGTRRVPQTDPGDKTMPSRSGGDGDCNDGRVQPP